MCSTGQYVVEGIAVQFNDTHFTQDASTTPWIAVFSSTESSKAGNTSDLISNAERLGAHAIIAYTVAGVISFCNLTTDAPAATIPIYTTELWSRGELIFSDELGGLFAPSTIKFYNASAMNKPAANITADSAALRADGSSLTQTNVVLARTPGIPMNVTAAAAEAAAEASKTTAARQGPTKTPSSAIRLVPGVKPGVWFAIVAVVSGALNSCWN
ncbi:hypothetical protein B0H14DRAFT_3855193 [Mycena olivaceomarginata]|nr:hypothetical protein B0H14DRAFT_3855193 [Mycena olivaceomarginata]